MLYLSQLPWRKIICICLKELSILMRSLYIGRREYNNKMTKGRMDKNKMRWRCERNAVGEIKIMGNSGRVRGGEGKKVKIKWQEGGGRMRVVAWWRRRRRMDGEGGRMRVKRETPAGSQTAIRMEEVFGIREGWLTGAGGWMNQEMMMAE